MRANYPDGFWMPEVQITNPSGGILGGDLLEVEVNVSPGASATVLSQAADKAYRGGGAFQASALRVGEDGFLEYRPHHLIPCAGSDYRQETTFHLAPDAALAWDPYAAGRGGRGSPSTGSGPGRASFGTVNPRL